MICLESRMAHSIFSPSKASRYFVCPGSVLAEAKADPQEEKPHMILGKIAHSLGETCLLEGKDPLDFRFDYIPYGDDQVQISEETANAVQVYVDFVLETLASYGLDRSALMIEQSLRYNDEIFGTADALFVAGDTLVVIDYKHGEGKKVDASENKQMLIYALMAYRLVGFVSKVRVAIVQPRTRVGNTIEEDSFDIATLLDFEEKFMAAVDRCKKEPNHFVFSSECNWCAAKLKCPGWKEKSEVTIGSTRGMVVIPDLDTLDSADLSNWMGRAHEFLALFTSLYAEAKNIAMSRMLIGGEKFDGYEIVQSEKRRAWENPDTAKETLVAKFGEAALEPKKLKSPAQINKLDKTYDISSLIKKEKKPEWKLKRAGDNAADLLEALEDN